MRAFLARAVRRRTRFAAVATALALAVPALAIMLNAHAPRGRTGPSTSAPKGSLGRHAGGSPAA
jgi:hypothetical protein